jgi:hypothetical protein
MPYIVDLSVRDVVSSVFKNIPETTIFKHRIRAESKINSKLKSKFQTPIVVKSDYRLSGDFLTQAGSTTINGISTLFNDELMEGQTIYCMETKEPLMIKTINSNLSLELFYPAKKTTFSGHGWVIPEEIVTATEFYTASLLLQYEYSDKAYNQEGDIYQKGYHKKAMEEIDNLLNSGAYNYKLEPQLAVGNEARLIEALDTVNSPQAEAFLVEIAGGSGFNVFEYESER